VSSSCAVVRAISASSFVRLSTLPLIGSATAAYHLIHVLVTSVPGEPLR